MPTTITEIIKAMQGTDTQCVSIFHTGRITIIEKDHVFCFENLAAFERGCLPAPTQATALKASESPILKVSALLLLLGLLLLGSGCAVIRYQGADGERFTAWTCLADDKIAKLAVDKRTKATSTGLSIGAIDHAIDDDAVQAIVAGVVEGIVKGVK